MEKATREQTKNHNSRLVLKTIYQEGDTSRAVISRITHLTRTTVSDIVAELISEDLLAEIGMGESAGGKPPILLKIRENSRQLVCIEIGRRDLRGALVNLRGRICKLGSEPLGEKTGASILAQMQGLIDRLLDAAEAPVIGIGVGVPGLTDPAKGIVRRSIQLSWTNVPIRQRLAALYPYPVYILNDSHAAALAEFTFGELQRSPNLIVVRIAEGIGAGILLSGQLHFGDGCGAGEIGHLSVVEGGRQCTCGNYGCLETVSSPRALIQRVKELAEYDLVAYVKTAHLEPGEIRWETIRRAFQAGDETAIELIKNAGSYLGISIANLVSILNVHSIVITGSFEEFGDVFLEAVAREVQRRALMTVAAETHISNSVLGPDNVILGVGALILMKEMGLP